MEPEKSLNLIGEYKGLLEVLVEGEKDQHPSPTILSQDLEEKCDCGLVLSLSALQEHKAQTGHGKKGDGSELVFDTPTMQKVVLHSGERLPVELLHENPIQTVVTEESVTFWFWKTGLRRIK